MNTETKNHLKELKTRINVKLKELETQQLETFKEVTEFLFKNNPDLKSFSFRGYTPSFNDGEPCEFSTTIDSPSVNGYNSDYGEWEDGSEEHTDEDEATSERLSEVVSAYLKVLPESFYGQKFGTSGFEVTVTKDKIKVEDYDCGY